MPRRDAYPEIPSQDPGGTEKFGGQAFPRASAVMSFWQLLGKRGVLWAPTDTPPAVN